MRKKTTLKLPENKIWSQPWYQINTVLRKVTCQDSDKTSVLILRTISILSRSCQDNNSDLTNDLNKYSPVGSRTHDLVIPAQPHDRLDVIAKTSDIAHI